MATCLAFIPRSGVRPDVHLDGGNGMDLRISPVEAEDDQALISLFRWLSRDVVVGREGRLSLETVDRRTGEMGGAFDIINAVFADASAAAGVAGLVLAYRTWRGTRSRAPRLRIEKDGVSVIVEDGSEAEIRRIVEALFPDAPAERAPESPEEGTGER
jgi:hypothetical protein